MEYRVASLDERKKYYSKEFDEAKVKKWFSSHKVAFPQLFAVDMGSESGIILDPKKKGMMMSIKSGHLGKKALKYLPEDIYYDRNVYKDVDKILTELNFKEVWESGNLVGQQLAFDIDSENIPCSCKKSKQKFCSICLRKAVENALSLGEIMEKRFSRISYVYSGRGMHVHIFDDEAYSFSIKEREELISKVKHLGIDPWVSRGYIRLMRLPYSLHGLISRIVLPLEKKDLQSFNPETDERVIPKFLMRKQK